MLVLCGGFRTDYIITAANQVRLMQMGGNAIFAAVGAKQWAADELVAILGRVGDNWPQGWTDDLRTAGFLVEGIRNIGGIQDLRTFYAYADNNTRDDTDPAQHFARVGAPLPPELADYQNSTPGQGNPNEYEPLAVTPEDFTLFLERYGESRSADRSITAHQSPFASAFALHIAPINFATQLNLPKAARAQGVNVVSIDPGERNMKPELMPFVEDMLGQVDIFMPSDQEVENLFPGDAMQMEDCARWFAERGPRLVVIKLGSDGCYVYERGAKGQAQQWHVPALPVNVVDVTGAGDTFCGGFMADFVQHADPTRAAVTGTVAASFCIEDYGALHVLEAKPHEIDHRAAFLRGLVQSI
jgi:pfkB family carbohydrate kinase